MKKKYILYSIVALSLSTVSVTQSASLPKKWGEWRKKWGERALAATVGGVATYVLSNNAPALMKSIEEYAKNAAFYGTSAIGALTVLGAATRYIGSTIANTLPVTVVKKTS